jgi:hypothetical protein
MHLMNSADHKSINYGIEYKGKTLRLGGSWLDICRNINLQVEDPKVQAALKLCMLEQLKTELRLTRNELE